MICSFQVADKKQNIMRTILLQCKFLLVEFLNVSYQLIPNPLRNWYLRLFGIRIWGGASLVSIEDVSSFMLVR